MDVVSEVTAPLEVERAEELIIRLGGAVNSRRIYAPGHNRAARSLDSFLAALREFPFKENEHHFEFTLSNGMLMHRGIPLGTQHAALTQIAATLEARNCKGVRLRRDCTAEALEKFVRWLGERLIRPFSNPPEGIELLSDGAASALRSDDGATLGIPDFNLPHEIHRTSARVLDRVMEEARSGSQIDFHEIIELTNWVSDAAFTHGTQLVSPTQMRHDPYTFHHSVNVFLISVSLLEPFARDHEELSRFALAALLHDVGKSRVPHEVLHKRGRLTEEEFQVMRQHPVHGAEILADSEMADPLVIEAAYCHHMRDDGLGYPNPELDIEPGAVTSIIQVADMFEALTAHRPYHRGRSAWDAVNIILQTPGMDSRRPAIALLIDRLTQSPPGSEVTLHTGEKAIVVKTFDDAPRRPLVHVIEDAAGHQLDEPRELDLREATDSAEPIVEICLKPSLTRERRQEMRTE